MGRFLSTTGLVIVAASLSVAGQPLSSITLPCKELQNTSLEGLADYLHGARSDLNATCMSFAISRLGARTYGLPSKTIASAAHLIVAFLDLEDPSYEMRRRSPGIVLPIEKYPAAIALMNIGKPTLPDLLNVIRSASSTAISRSNAVSVISFLYRDNPEAGVSLLNDENRSSHDRGVSDRFLAAAHEAVDGCYREHRAKCEMILWDQSGK